MILIAHRGNTHGPDLENENKPEYLKKAIDMGFHVETDVWYIDGEFYLGHDVPQYPIDLPFLNHRKIICHCKNIEAFDQILSTSIHCFFHDEDDCTLTSKGWIWTYPGKQLTSKSICVMPERVVVPENIDECKGICTDYAALMKNF